MSETDKTSVAALISVILRRKANRVIDVKWLVKNAEYAREIIELSRQQEQADLTEYANTLERLMFGTGSDVPTQQPLSAFAATQPQFDPVEAGGEIDPLKYVGSLR